MTQDQIIEIIKKQFPNIRDAEIRLHLNEGMKEFCRRTRIVTGGFQFTTNADQRYYDLDDGVSEVTSVDYDGYDIPRLTGRPEKRDIS